MAPDRFVTLSCEQKENIIENIDSANTKKTTVTAVKLLREYLTAKNVSADFENFSNEELDNRLSDFYMEMRNKTGEMHKKSTLQAYRHGIQRYLEKTNPSINIVTGEQFKKSIKSFKSMTKEFKRQGLAVVEHHPPISDSDLERAYAYLCHGDFGDVQRLQYKVFLDIMLHFGRRGRENLASLTRADFAVLKDGSNFIFIKLEMKRPRIIRMTVKDLRMVECMKYKVCFCDINDKEGEETRAECAEKFGDSNVMFTHCDVCVERDIKDVLEAAKRKFQRIDIFINNAAIVDENNWEKMIDVNLNGYVRGTSLAIECFRKDKGGNGGVIINVSSITGILPYVLFPLYVASKHGIIGYSRTMAMRPELKDNGIRIACLCPTVIDTPMLQKVLSEQTGRDSEVVNRTVKDMGLLSMDTVAEGMVKILQDEDNNGGRLVVDRKSGMVYLTDDDELSKRFLGAQT